MTEGCRKSQTVFRCLSILFSQDSHVRRPQASCSGDAMDCLGAAGCPSACEQLITDSRSLSAAGRQVGQPGEGVRCCSQHARCAVGPPCAHTRQPDPLAPSFFCCCSSPLSQSSGASSKGTNAAGQRAQPQQGLIDEATALWGGSRSLQQVGGQYDVPRGVNLQSISLSTLQSVTVSGCESLEGWACLHCVELQASGVDANFAQPAGPLLVP